MASEVAKTLGDARHDAIRGGNAALHGIGNVLDFTLLNVGGVDFTVGALLAALLVLLGAVVVSRLARRALERYAVAHSGVNRATVYALSRVVHYLLLTVGVVLALNAAGIQMARFTVLAGALGVGLGFGLQAIFNNFVSGLIILFDRTLKVGDFVELASGVHGTVRDIYIRATRITTNDNIDIIVPNSEFVSGRVVNWTLREVSRRLKVPFGVAYGSDKELVKRAALEAAAEVPFTLTLEGERKPQVWLTGFGDSSLNFSLVVWLTAEATKRPGAVTAAYNWALETALNKHAIEIPFPQRDLHLRTWFGLSGEQAREQSRQVPTRTQGSAARTRQYGPPSENDAARDVEREIAEASDDDADDEVPRR
ncbi:MAG: mechanosensitive ion channel domain-containing protein [Rudaea sp.]